MNKVGMRKCPCGEAGCIKWHLTGMGNFYQGSGFTEDEARLIIAALHGDAGELARALIQAMVLIKDLMPGIRYISVPDYELLNEVPIAAQRALAGSTRTPERRAFDILSQAWEGQLAKRSPDGDRGAILLALQLMVRGQEREDQPGMGDAGKGTRQQRRGTARDS